CGSSAANGCVVALLALVAGVLGLLPTRRVRELAAADHPLLTHDRLLWQHGPVLRLHRFAGVLADVVPLRVDQRALLAQRLARAVRELARDLFLVRHLSRGRRSIVHGCSWFEGSTPLCGANV